MDRQSEIDAYDRALDAWTQTVVALELLRTAAGYVKFPHQLRGEIALSEVCHYLFESTERMLTSVREALGKRPWEVEAVEVDLLPLVRTPATELRAHMVSSYHGRSDKIYRWKFGPVEKFHDLLHCESPNHRH